MTQNSGTSPEDGSSIPEPTSPAAQPPAAPAPVTTTTPVPPPMPSASAASGPAPTTVNQSVVVMQRQAGPGLLVRAVWFLFIGWWLSLFAIGVAYFLCLIIIGLPLGFMIFNRLPVILTLRARTDVQTVEVRDGVTYVSGGTVAQLPLWARAIWFLFLGWWVGAFYLGIAWFLCVILITMPVGLYMFNRVGGVMTLLRY